MTPMRTRTVAPAGRSPGRSKAYGPPGTPETIVSQIHGSAPWATKAALKTFCSTRTKPGRRGKPEIVNGTAGAGGGLRPQETT